MKLRSLQIIALGTSGMALAMLAMTSFVFTRQPLDLTSKPAAPWSPPPEEDKTQIKAPIAPGETNNMLVRPIFLPDRKPFRPPPPPAPIPQPEAPAPQVVAPVAPPPAPTPEPPAPSPPPPLTATLKGVLLTDALDKAYLVSPEAPDGTWVTVGAQVSGWKLTHIAKDQVTLILGEQMQVLQLYVDNPEMPVGNPPAPN